MTNLLLPTDGRWPESIRIKVTRDGENVGWAALRDTTVNDGARFGSMRVGSATDCLARPEAAPAVVAAATRYLCERGVDEILSNQTHPDWIDAFRARGYAILENKRLFAISPQLEAAMSPWETVSRGLHVTNLAGHGPHLM